MERKRRCRFAGSDAVHVRITQKRGDLAKKHGDVIARLGDVIRMRADVIVKHRETW